MFFVTLFAVSNYTPRKLEKDEQFFDSAKAIHANIREGLELGAIEKRVPVIIQYHNGNQLVRKQKKIAIDLIDGHGPLDFDEPLQLELTEKEFKRVTAFRNEHIRTPLRHVPMKERLEILPLLAKCNSALLDKVSRSILVQTMMMNEDMIHHFYGQRRFRPKSQAAKWDLVSAQLINGHFNGELLHEFMLHVIAAPPHARARLHAIDWKQAEQALHSRHYKYFLITLKMNPKMRAFPSALRALVDLFPSIKEPNFVKRLIVAAAVKWHIQPVEEAVPPFSDYENPLEVLGYAAIGVSILDFYRAITLPGDHVNTLSPDTTLAEFTLHGPADLPVSHNATILSWAARWNKKFMVFMLLQLPNIDVNKKDIDGRTALMIALYNNQCEAARLLLQHRQLDLGAVDRIGFPTLEYLAGRKWEIMYHFGKAKARLENSSPTLGFFLDIGTAALSWTFLTPECF